MSEADKEEDETESMLFWPKILELGLPNFPCLSISNSGLCEKIM